MIRFLLVLLVSAFSALGFARLADNPVLFEGIEIVINLAGAAGIGLTAGFFTRVLLEKRGTFLRWIVSLIGGLSGLLVLGGSTNWQYGIGPMSFNSMATDWSGLGLIILGSVTAIIADQAYRIPARTQRAVHRSMVGNTRSVSRQASMPARNTDARSRRRTVENLETPWQITGQDRRNAVIKSKNQPAKKKKLDGATRKKTRPTPAVTRKRAAKKIVIAPVEEHRCPYCLEPVKRNDPRGVVECSICHTLHHVDCWAVTGTCQVPHYNH